MVEGRPDAFPVIFLHGLPGGAFIWAAVIKALGRERLCIAPDLPGWGRSFTRFAKTAPDLSVEGLRSWLNGLLLAQNIQRFDLVAQGNGTWLAMDLLMADPSRVRRLALVSAQFWGADAQASLFERLLGRAKWSRKRIERWLNESAALSGQAREQYRALFGNLLVTEKDARKSPLLSEMGCSARMGDYRAALATYKGSELLIWGENDPQSPEEKVAELGATLKGAEVHRITNAGHFPMLDAPEEVAALLKEFLGE